MKNDTQKLSSSLRGDFSAKNSGSGKCGVCRQDLPEQARGRPREYCDGACADVADAVRRLQRAMSRVEKPAAMRSLIVAEVLNRLPLDSQALSERARRQARDPGGQFS